MSKQAGGRPAKSGARRELKTFRLVPDAIARLERLAGERGGSTSDVLNEVLLELSDAARARRLEVFSPAIDAEADGRTAPAVARFRVIDGGGQKPIDAAKVSHELERLRDSLAGVLEEIEGLMAEQVQDAESEDEYASGFKAGMLEALETTFTLLQSELLTSDDA